MITQDHLKELLHYDPETGLFTWLVSRGSSKRGKIAGHRKESRGKHYIEIIIYGKHYKAHRLAFLYMDGDFPEEEVDHDDGDGTNNKWRNIDYATRNDNSMNKRIYSNNKTGVCGVYIDHKNNGKYRAFIKVNNKTISLGTYEHLNEAAKVRKAAEEFYGFHPNHAQSRPLY